MDDLANELSCTMIDVDSEKSASGRGGDGGGGSGLTTGQPTPSSSHTNLDHLDVTGRRETICGGEASGEGDGGAHYTGNRERVPMKKEDRDRDRQQQKDQLSQIETMLSDHRCFAGQSNSPRGNTSTKPVARSASILLRSKVLILSDSESDEEENSLSSCQKNGDEISNCSSRILTNRASSLRRKKMKKHRRKKTDKQKDNPFGPLNQCFGKRKRSTTISMTLSGEGGPSTSGATNSSTNEHQGMIAMECECFESSSLSESSINSEVENTYDEADDEQSDFYEVMSKTGGKIDGSSHSSHHVTKHSNSRSRHSMAIPKNPFAMVTASGSSTPSGSFSSSSSMIWKRRKRNQWP